MDNKKLTWKRIILFYVIAFLPFAIITPVLCKVYGEPNRFLFPKRRM